MGKRTGSQDKVEAFIEKNKIHLSSGAIVDKRLLQKKSSMVKEFRNAKEILTRALGKFLLTGDRVEDYITQEIANDPNMVTMKFDCFIFSADQLRDFVEEITEKEKPRILH